MLNRVTGLALAAMASSLLFSTASQAAVYNFEFDSTTAGALTAIGTVTVVPNGPDLEITGITGTISGTDLSGTQTITGVVPNPGFPGTTLSPDGQFNYDNVGFNAEPHLDASGILFTTAENTTGFWNLFFENGSYSLDESVNNGLALAELGALQTEATPLPAALPMFLAGAGFIGMVTRRRKQKRAA